MGSDTSDHAYDEYLSEVGVNEQWLNDLVVRFLGSFALLENEITELIALAWLRGDRSQESFKHLLGSKTFGPKLDMAKKIIERHQDQNVGPLEFDIDGEVRKFEIRDLQQDLRTLLEFRNTLAHGHLRVRPEEGRLQAMLTQGGRPKGEFSKSIDELEDLTTLATDSASLLMMLRIAERRTLSEDQAGCDGG